MKARFTRDFYIPKGAEEIRATDCEAVAYLEPYWYRPDRNGNECWHAIGFSGKQSKPDWNFTFKTEAEARKYIAEHFASRKRTEDFRAEQRAAKANVRAADHFKIGDLLHTSWGYDQTNVEFFKIVRVLEKTVEVVAIGGKAGSGDGCGPMAGYCTPDPDNVLVDEWACKYNGVKRVCAAGGGSASVYIHRHSNGYLTKPDAKVYESWYA